MIAVIFEMWPKASHQEEFAAYTADITALVEQQEGFVSFERFQSTVEDGKLLSLSFFRDEEALEGWRSTIERYVHESPLGHCSMLFNYRLRIADVKHDASMEDFAEQDFLEVVAQR
jgi:heme-degrading monooxygenase HmoA